MEPNRIRRSTVIAAATAVWALTAGCGGADQRADQATTTTTTTPGVTTSPPLEGATAPSTSGARGDAPQVRSTTRTTSTQARPSTPSTNAPDAGETSPGGGDVQPTATDDGSQGPPGAFARTLLRPQPATTIVLDRFAQDGVTLGAAAVDHATRMMGEVTKKRVDVRSVAALGSTDTSWTADEIRSTADRVARVPQGTDRRAAVRLLVLRGSFDGNEQVLGVTVRGDVVALFPERIADAATPLVSRAALEDAVLLHELGHVLGLVDLARDTGRADKEHPGHSSNTASVMYWAVDSSLVGQVLNGPPPNDFDRDDLADLAALRNGA
ncbi:MAG TPA: hypothetical protein VM143_04215 [Acidimicrobiales bacterium]|nr:hypothetical protein [Acidimicrobiales bacterium]